MRSLGAMMVAAWMMGCSAKEAPPDRPLDTRASAPPIGAATATDAAATDTADAPSSSSGDGARGAAAPPSWVVEAPAFLPFLTSATPVCRRSETILHDLVDKENAFSHGYSVYVPAVAQRDLEARFAETARKLGLPVKRDGSGTPSAVDEALQAQASVSDSRVRVFFLRKGSTQQAIVQLARGAGARTAELLAALGADATSREATLEDVAGGNMTFQVRMELRKSVRATVAKWAGAEHLVADGHGWLRRYDPKTPEVPTFVIDLDDANKMDVFEGRGPVVDGPACKDHPSRAPLPSASAKSTSGPASSPSDDDLMRQMMGK